jgi:galactitol PTS system EIIA component
MDDNKWFFEENLITHLIAENKEEAIQKLGNLLLVNGYVKDSYTPAVIAREKEFATGLPTPEIGVAIPHTDAHHVLKQAVAVGILPNPVSFCEMGDTEDTPVSVRVIFMLAVPDKNKVMTMLQQIIGIIQSQDFLKEIIATTDRDKLIAILDKQLNADFYEKAAEAGSPEAKSTLPEINLVVQHPVGLHARPATLFVKIAKQYNSNITVYCKGKEANAKSILKVLALGADQGAQITIRAEGNDADQALKELRELVESNFGGIA